VAQWRAASLALEVNYEALGGLVSYSTILLLSVVAFLRERVTVTLVTTLAFHVAITVWLFVIHWSSP
jgi:hypothetical protein